MKSLFVVSAITLTTIIGLLYISQSNLPTLNLRAVPTYDAYVLAVQWGKTMCVSGGSSCEKKLSNIPKNHMSIHGLWPGMKSGARIAECNQGAEISIVDDGSATFLEARKYWPSLNNNANTVFWGHEYNKHGYCYSNRIKDFDYKKYFQRTIDLLKEKHINTLILDTFGEQSGEYKVSFKDLKNKIKNKLGGDYFSVVCKTISKKQYLQEIRISFDDNFNYIKTSSGGSCNTGKDVIISYR